MSAAQLRGGLPRTSRITTAATHAKWDFPFTTNYLLLRNLGATVIKVYWLEVDATNDVNYITVPVAAAANPNGEWQGPVDCQAIWIESASGTPVLEVTAFQKRG